MTEKDRPIQKTKPDTMNENLVSKLFVAFPDIYNNVIKPGHTILYGPRDSGKSMLLRYLSLSVQLKKPQTLQDVPIVGFYFPLSASLCGPFVEAHDCDPGKYDMFSHYLSVLFVEVLLDELHKQSLQIDDELRSLLIQAVLESATFMPPTEDPIHFLESYRQSISDYVESRKSLVATEEHSITYFHNLVPILCSRFNRIFSKAMGREVVTHILIDGYENLESLSPAINVLIERFPRPSYYLKIGARRFGSRISHDLRKRPVDFGQDYTVVSLHWNHPGQSRYRKWIRAVINAHFEYTNDSTFQGVDIFSYLETGNPDKILLFEEDYSLPIFLTKKRGSRQRNYHGFNAYSLLSSGIIGAFIVLCDDLTLAGIQKDDKPLHMISKIAVERANTEFKLIMGRGREHGLKLQRLVYHSLLECERRFLMGEGDEAITCPVILDRLDSKEDTELFEMLKKGLEEGIIQSYEKELVEHEVNDTIPQIFWPNLIFSPKLGLKPWIP